MVTPAKIRTELTLPDHDLGRLDVSSLPFVVAIGRASRR
jgi:hypothetical protein